MLLGLCGVCDLSILLGVMIHTQLQCCADCGSRYVPAAVQVERKGEPPAAAAQRPETVQMTPHDSRRRRHLSTPQLTPDTVHSSTILSRKSRHSPCNKMTAGTWAK